MWNNQNSSYPGQYNNQYQPPSGPPGGQGPPSFPSFPSAPGGFGQPSYNAGSPGPGGYNPAYNSPQGPPPPSGYGSSPSGYPPPAGPPPFSTYPGQQAHNQHNRPQGGGYPPPPGPPSAGFPSPPPGAAGGFPGAQSQSPGFPGASSPAGGFPTATQGGGYLNTKPSSYGPPSGPPPSSPYGAPPGPPPSSPYGAPPGPPPSSPYGAPPGPPPNQSQSSYGAPSGPPPPVPANKPYQAPGSGYQGGGGYGGGGVGGGYQAPSGPPPRPPTQQQTYGPQFENTRTHEVQQPFFQYSQCNGKRKALCIGINYVGQDAELAGCINDAHNVKKFLCSQFGYKEDDIVMLTDDAPNARQKPTRENMLTAMQWLVQGAAPNDALFFHYSGHGGQTKDLDGDEDDGFDEVIYPVDYESAGHIVDDDMHAIMVRPLPPGCRLTAIFDSCHSGTALDLPYVYSTEGKIKEPNLAAEAGQGLLSAVTSYAKGDKGGMLKSAMGLVKLATGSQKKAENLTRATRTSPADCISFSGCKDSQTSADTVEAGKATGAMSFAFISALSQNPQQSYQQLLVNLREILRGKYSQKPQLSASHPIDTNLMFVC
ncbi:hypothetical protein JAAARDRAFT_68700 [Jaapia argillacea MUCL 33604]|uniref:Peptidase C14 caspase domain-containing protein n=1 Tax=Jaapia argillacea MUCL 33604 TaxID=933084 RepID=A0A067PWH1_9AGAM|nr:hypothetical protein JAAARDRAFT_68700 [Jaapia argillacea MUCL 33604]